MKIYFSVRERLSMVVFCPELGAAAVDPGGTLAELLRPGTVGVAVVVVVVVVVVGGGGGDDDGFDVGGGCCCCCCCGGGGGLEALNCLTQWPELVLLGILQSYSNFIATNDVGRISFKTSRYNWFLIVLCITSRDIAKRNGSIFSVLRLLHSPMYKKRDSQVCMNTENPRTLETMPPLEHLHKSGKAWTT
ncbi:hypothetical protein GQX74_008937 [Glossina fuscipes]|nr:hypothetical protein GQX74_008937 [Glossina fuscipes]